MAQYEADEECWKLPEQDFAWDTASELALYQVGGLVISDNKTL
jgi:hypothetical protein